MGYGVDRAQMEAELARAHRALYRAADAAERDGDRGAEEDLRQLLAEVTRIAERSLKGKARPRLDGQLRLTSS